TMSCGVVHNLFGHDVILVLGAPGLLVANLVQKALLPQALQMGSSPTPYVFRRSGIVAQMQNFSILRVSQRSHGSDRIAVYPDRSGWLECLLRWRVVADRGVPLPLSVKEFYAANPADNRPQEPNGQNLFLEQSRDADAVAF